MKKNNDKFSFIQDCPVRKLRNTGIRKKRSFFEAINSRGLEQLTYVFQELQAKAAKILPGEHAKLGNLVVIDGS